MPLATPPEVYTSMGLLPSEFELIVKLIGREPTLTEIGMFAVMWSEHCGYKYSRPLLSLFKKYREAIEGKGLENAGVVDIGDGVGVTMKVESHNHPSAVEPYEGAATGVGGIIRDILTMGARPIASLNSLRFGPIWDDGVTSAAVVDRNRYLFEHVVAGIAGYGNCVGVPTVAGEVSFHKRYSGNPLVNAMCVGVLDPSHIATASAAGIGNTVLYLGSSTGKDGIHGATFASDALGEDNQDKRPNVQIGDPFAEKQVIEATLEALQTGAIVAIQDMGAAGLTCSTIEMAAKGGVGMTVDLDKVPMRESDMSAYELMLSESQERMLAVVEKGREHEVIDVFHKWGLNAVAVGEVTEDELVTITRFGTVEAKLKAALLADECPTYTNTPVAPDSFFAAGEFQCPILSDLDVKEALLKLLSWPEISDKRWVYEQYDQQVQTQTVAWCGVGDAAVLAIRGTSKGIALKIDGVERFSTLHPHRGGMLAVVEAARNVACVGAKPVAVTDCLNFGNPTYPKVYWQFSEAVKGIAEACDALDTPVISGNVSFYNESDLGEVPPTPVIGMMGVLEDATKWIPAAPRQAAELWMVDIPGVAAEQQGLGASALLAAEFGVEDGYPVAPSLEGEKRVCAFLAENAASGMILSAHDASQGGLAVAAAEIALSGMRVEIGGVAISFDGVSEPKAALFAEIPGVVLIGIEAAKASAVADDAGKRGLRARRIGAVSRGAGLIIGGVEWGGAELRKAHSERIPSLMSHA